MVDLFASSVTSVLNALVHRSVSDAARPHHTRYIATHLGLAFTALAVAPFFLAFHGAPDLSDTLVLACTFAPLAGACVVLRTGRLDWGHATNILGLVALSLILWLDLGAGIGCAVTWLVAAQVEAIGDRNLRTATAIVTAAILLMMATMPSTGAARSEAVDAIFSALAFAYAAIGALSFSSHDRATEDVRNDESRKTALEVRTEDRSWAETALLAGGAVLELDERGSVLALHNAPGEAPALDPRHVLARGFFEHVHVADRPVFLKLVADAAHGTSCAPANVRLRSWSSEDATSHRPTHRPLELRVVPSRAGGVVVALVRDVTETVSEGGDRSSELHHDLRSPLNAIIGFSEMLASRTLRPADVETQYEYARIVHQSGQTLLGLIDTMVRSSKSSASVTPLLPPRAAETESDLSPEYRIKKRA